MTIETAIMSHGRAMRAVAEIPTGELLDLFQRGQRLSETCGDADRLIVSMGLLLIGDELLRRKVESG